MAEPDTEEETQAPPPKAAPAWRKAVMIGVGALLLVGVSVGVTLALVHTELAPSPATSSATHQAAARAAGKAEASTPAPKPAEDEGKPIYLALDPAFVVNFHDHNQMRFLQIGVEVMSRDQKAIDAVKLNMPQVRDRLVMLFSSQSYDDINTMQGKEKLRAEALQQVQQVLEKEIGDPGVQAVYFTSFVMQ